MCKIKKKQLKISSVDKIVEQPEISHNVVGSVEWYKHIGKCLAFLMKLNIHPSYGPFFPLGMYP